MSEAAAQVNIHDTKTNLSRPGVYVSGPFDRMLIAQAKAEDLTLVTRDAESPGTTSKSWRRNHAAVATTRPPDRGASRSGPRSMALGGRRLRWVGGYGLLVR